MQIPGEKVFATEETFREPFRTRILEALENAYSMCWEGCHKIYVTMDVESHDTQIEYGYEMVRVEDEEEALYVLFEWFKRSCSLRFISAISSRNQFTDLIPQFEYNNDPGAESE